VGTTGLEPAPAASAVTGSCNKSILLVRLALFCVMVHGFGPNLAVVGPKLDPILWGEPLRWHNFGTFDGEDLRPIHQEVGAMLSQSYRRPCGHPNMPVQNGWPVGQFQLNANFITDAKATT